MAEQVVVTPLPPRKRCQTGWLCPSVEPRPAQSPATSAAAGKSARAMSHCGEGLGDVAGEHARGRLVAELVADVGLARVADAQIKDGLVREMPRDDIRGQDAAERVADDQADKTNVHGASLRLLTATTGKAVCIGAAACAVCPVRHRCLLRRGSSLRCAICLSHNTTFDMLLPAIPLILPATPPALFYSIVETTP